MGATLLDHAAGPLTQADIAGAGDLRYVKITGSSLGIPDVIVEEQQPSGTNGGSSTSGSYITRGLNTIVRNFNSIASLASNQVTLSAGTYYFRWSAQASNSNSHKSRLLNATDTAVVGYGTSAYAPSGSATDTVGATVLTISAPKAFALQHQVGVSAASNGFGVAGSFGTEVYSRLEITKMN
jgi:hypothetical protein